MLFAVLLGTLAFYLFYFSRGSSCAGKILMRKCKAKDCPVPCSSAQQCGRSRRACEPHSCSIPSPSELCFQVTACFHLKHWRKKEKKKKRPSKDETPRNKMQLFFQGGFMALALRLPVLKRPPHGSLASAFEVSHTHLNFPARPGA